MANIPMINKLIEKEHKKYISLFFSFLVIFHYLFSFQLVKRSPTIFQFGIEITIVLLLAILAIFFFLKSFIKFKDTQSELFTLLNFSLIAFSTYIVLRFYILRFLLFIGFLINGTSW